jgi:hypothetical protein
VVQVSLTALVKSSGGPSMSLEATLSPLSYSVASVSCPPQRIRATVLRERALLPDDGTVTLLSVRARTNSGRSHGDGHPAGGPERSRC